MSGFVFFVLVLTFVYVVYFAVMITLDLHGKKDEKKSEEETYDVGDMTNEEQPVAIEERNDNPDEGDMTFTEQITDDGLRVVNPTGNVTPHSSFIEEPPNNLTRQHGEHLFVMSCEIHAVVHNCLVHHGMFTHPIL